ncbi:MAG: glycoside hydrolase family 27 protein [Gammaproteobacteria bacterium]|nr:glycoside hydrolase family 27 protein [Gammaproteobacteria bacterium]
MRTLTRVILMLACFLSGLAMCGGAYAAGAPLPAHSYNGLALTPPMGFNNWAHYECKLNEQLFVDTANTLVSTGLAKLGYRYVNIDDCWMEMQRDAAGELVPNPKLFPHGMRWLGDYLHSKGLKFGIYEDAGYMTCQKAPGMYGHIEQDVRTFASWGVDYLKLDYCYAPQDQYPGKNFSQVAQIVYTRVSEALHHSGRDIVFSCSPPAYVFGKPGEFAEVMRWIGSVCNLWRTDDDIYAAWKSVVANYAGNVGLAKYAFPGGWNDADMLEVGNPGMSLTEQQSQFSLWAMMASPLLISTDVAKLSPAALKILSNADVIAVDQDPLGRQASIVKQIGQVDILSRPLADGDHAVALFNKGERPEKISVNIMAIGLRPGRYQLENLWSKQVSETRAMISVEIPAHGVGLYRVSAAH